MKLVGLAAWVGAAMAFTDTAAFYAPFNLGEFGYVSDFSAVSDALYDYTSAFCSERPSETLLVYQVSRLLRKLPSAEGTFIKHVQSPQARPHFDFPGECEVSNIVYGEEPWDSNVVIVNVADGKAHEIAEFVADANGRPFVVCGEPQGEAHFGVKGYLQDKVNVVLDQLAKRSRRSDEWEGLSDDEAEATLQEVEDDFRAAESMVAEEEATATILADEGTVYAASNSTAKSNLFTEYQFFTPGVWLALIVSGFLLYVAYTAVGWITSIELLYGAFEKQVDYEKKTE